MVALPWQNQIFARALVMKNSWQYPLIRLSSELSSKVRRLGQTGMKGRLDHQLDALSFTFSGEGGFSISRCLLH